MMGVEGKMGVDGKMGGKKGYKGRGTEDGSAGSMQGCMNSWSPQV
jgi:hypothetical protein